MPLATPTMGPMPSAPYANQGGNVITPWKPPKAASQKAPTVSYGPHGGINVAFAGAPASSYLPAAPGPFGTVLSRAVGSAAGQVSAQQTAAQNLQAQLAAALGLSDAQYRGKANDLLLQQTQAQTGRDLAIGNLQADTEAALGQIAGQRYRNDLGIQGVQADRNYAVALNDAYNQETSNLWADIGRQRDFLARAYGIETSQLDALLGFAGEDRDITNRALDAQTGFAGERRSLSDRSSQLSFDTNNRQALSDATARGAITSQGFADTRSELARQLGLAREGSDLDYRSTISDIGTRRSQNDLGYRKTVSEVGSRRSSAELNRDKGNASLDSTWADREVSNLRQSAGLTKSLSDASLQEASLRSVAADFGMQESQLKDRLARGINAANLDYASSIAAIENGLRSNDEQQRAEAIALMSGLAGV